MPAHSAPALTISIYEEIADISQIWLKFQIHAATTLYQTFQWCNAWQQTVGHVRDCNPRILVGRDAKGKVVFILPLQIRRLLGLRILEWHGYPSVNYGYGLFDHEFLPVAARWFDQQFDNLLELVGPYDVLSLQDLPTRLHHYDHPLLTHVNLNAANRAFAINLQKNFESLYASKRSLATRKSHRKRDARLGAMGELSFGLPATNPEAHRVLDEMFTHQAKRLAQSGVHGIFGKTEKDFFHRLIDETDAGLPFLMPYVLKCNGATLAVILGGRASDTFWPFISSMGPTAAQKHSPGDYALRHVIEDCCKLGLSTFDFAAGESNYKSQWADEVIGLGVILRAGNWRGLLWVAAHAASLTVKRLIKQNRVILSLIFMIRRAVAGQKSSSEN